MGVMRILAPQVEKGGGGVEGDEGIESVRELGGEMKGEEGMKGEEHCPPSPSHGEVVFALASGAAVGEIERSKVRD